MRIRPILFFAALASALALAGCKNPMEVTHGYGVTISNVSAGAEGATYEPGTLIDVTFDITNGNSVPVYAVHGKIGDDQAFVYRGRIDPQQTVAFKGRIRVEKPMPRKLTVTSVSLEP